MLRNEQAQEDYFRTMSLFQTGHFVSHSGLSLNWKIECDALTQEDFDTIAVLFSRYSGIVFSKVYGIPTGGMRLAKSLEKYTNNTVSQLLIVDDVVTTGTSLIDAKEKLGDLNAIGFVAFSRGKCPDWVYSFMRTSYWIP